LGQRSGRRSAAISRRALLALAVLINIVPGIIVTIAAFTLIDFDKARYKLFDDNFDFAGLVFMAGFLGALNMC